MIDKQDERLTEWLHNPKAKPSKELSEHDQKMIQLGWDAKAHLAKADKGEGITGNTDESLFTLGEISVHKLYGTEGFAGYNIEGLLKAQLVKDDETPESKVKLPQNVGRGGEGNDEPDKHRDVCPECLGKGRVVPKIAGHVNFLVDLEDCPTCQGTGKASNNETAVEHGRRLVQEAVVGKHKLDNKREKIAETIRNYDVSYGHATKDCSYLSYLEVADQIIAALKESENG